MKKSLEGKKIGLALGGGAVLGAAHIGVLKALDEYDIEIAGIAGTSIGAVVGSLHAFGVTCDDVTRIAMDLSWKDIGSFSLSRYGLLSNDKIKGFMENQIGDVSFGDAHIPLAVVATNISNGAKVVLKEGPVAEAVMASTCIPGIFSPVELNDELLVDGGIVENVPVSPLKEMDVDYIIAVDLNGAHKYKKPENIMDVLINSFHFTLEATAKLSSDSYNLLIEPDLSKFNRYDTDQTQKLIEKGYEDAKAALEKID